MGERNSPQHRNRGADWDHGSGTIGLHLKEGKGACTEMSGKNEVTVDSLKGTTYLEGVGDGPICVDGQVAL
ncbi:MAG: hypothetical protein AUG89_06835 [Acidobacteria bacterium 13_1_20CM_4_56_7]|nr:MAG: hypothetical protein AUG89_06835 [Acidobacteria bacterium 13_1_20CM_4_56_7]